MKKLLSLLCVLSLSAALLAGCSTAGDAGTSETPGSSSTPSEVTEPGSSQETVDSLDVNVMALKGPTAMGMVKIMADSEPVEEFTDQLKEEYENVVSSGNIYHFTITSATDEVSAALAQGTTDIPKRLPLECPLPALFQDELGRLFCQQGAVKFRLNIRWKFGKPLRVKVTEQVSPGGVCCRRESFRCRRSLQRGR